MDVPDRLTLSQSSELYQQTTQLQGSPTKYTISQIDLFDHSLVPDIAPSLPDIKLEAITQPDNEYHPETISVIDQILENFSDVPGNVDITHEEEDYDDLDTTALNTTICLSPTTPKHPPTFFISPLMSHQTTSPELHRTNETFLSSHKELVTPKDLLSTQTFFDEKPVRRALRKTTPRALPSTQIFLDSKFIPQQHIERKRSAEHSLQHPALRRCLFSAREEKKDGEQRNGIDEISVIHLSIEEELESAEKALETITVLRREEDDVKEINENSHVKNVVNNEKMKVIVEETMKENKEEMSEDRQPNQQLKETKISNKDHIIFEKRPSIVNSYQCSSITHLNDSMMAKTPNTIEKENNEQKINQMMKMEREIEERKQEQIRKNDVEKEIEERMRQSRRDKMTEEMIDVEEIVDVKSTTLCAIQEITDLEEEGEEELINSPELVRKMFTMTKIPAQFPAYPPHITKVVPIPLPVSTRRIRSGLTRRAARVSLHPYVRPDIKREE